MKVKGIAIAIMPGFVREKFGPDGHRRWLESLTPEARKIFTANILISKWYPAPEAYAQPTEAMCRLFYGGEVRGAWELGRYSADYALKGVYKAFVKSPVVTVTVGHASLILPNYFQPATIEIKSLEQQRAVLRLTRFESSTHYIEYRIGGWIERAVEIDGGREVKVDITRSLAHQDPYTEFVLAWR